jgi:hypothetical protein
VTNQTTTAAPIWCGECGEDYPAGCPDMCGTLFGSIESTPPARRRRRVQIRIVARTVRVPALVGGAA